MVTRPLPEPWLAPLRDAGLELDVADRDAPMAPEALQARAPGAAALWVQLDDRVDAALLDAAGPSLRVVATFSVGTDHVDLQAAAARGVRVANTPDVLTDATADQGWALLLAVARRLREGHALVQRGEWDGWSPTRLLGTDLADRTLAIVGLGRIGTAMAHRGRAFGMRVAYHGPRPHPERAAELDARFEPDLDALVRSADVLSLHAPLTPSTRHLLDARRLALLPPHAIVVNVGRGSLIDEPALVAALREGRIGGAALDVFEHEPQVPAELLAAPNVALAPHQGSATRATRAAMAARCVDAILAALAEGGTA
ncbi:MAG: D-glycerate dehydrogenase [Trueperaceae bacterium]|nr:D-glycerate dehydrogenase [Trueperaceae bacterium]